MMRPPLAALALAAALWACLAAAAVAGPRDDALAVIQKWTAAFLASDVDALVALHAPDALFMGTGSTSVVTDTRDIRKYFEGALLTDKPRGAPIRSTSVMVLGDDAVLVVALMLVAYGFPVAQFFVYDRPGAIVHRVDGSPP